MKVIVEGRKIITYSLCLIRLSKGIYRKKTRKSQMAFSRLLWELRTDIHLMVSEYDTISQSSFSPHAGALNYHFTGVPKCVVGSPAFPAMHAADRHSQVNIQMSVLVWQNLPCLDPFLQHKCALISSQSTQVKENGIAPSLEISSSP